MIYPAPTKWLMAWLLITGILIVFYPPFAVAIGDDVTLGSFSCSGGTANGQLSLMSGTCPTTLNFDNVFSFLTCSLQQLASNILGHMYCGLIFQLTPAVWAMVTLAVLFFGIAFTIGLVAATGGEAVAFILKAAFVIAFATEADFLIGVAYSLLISGMTDGVTIVLNGMGVTNATTGAEAFQLLDNFLKQIIDYAIGGSGNLVGEDRCRNALFAVLATIGVAFPMVAYFSIALIAKILFSLFRAIFGYIYAIFGVTFLIILSPIFVAFYLFKPTQHFFNKWLGHLASMVIQVVLLFAFLTFILSLPISNMTSNLSTLIMYQSQAAETTSIRLPWRYCTLCDFRVVNATNTAQEITDRGDDFIRNANLVCNIYTPTNDPNAAGFDPARDATDATGRKPITMTFALSPKTSDGQMNALLTFFGNGILALIVLAIVVERLLTNIPYLAQRLGSGLGGSYTPQMGGGDGVVVAPGESLARDLGAGFSRSRSGSPEANGLRGSEQGITDALSGPTQKIKDSLAFLVSGKTGSQNATTAISETQKQNGLTNWRGWISKP